MKIEYVARSGYLYSKVTGDFNLQEVQASLPVGIQECVRHKLNKVLVDLTELQGYSSMIDRYIYLEALGKLHEDYVQAGHPPISVVYVGSDRFVSDFGYEERVAEPYSLTIKTSTNLDEGLEWVTAQ